MIPVAEDPFISGGKRNVADEVVATSRLWLNLS
jgi:hypothetical protein